LESDLTKANDIIRKLQEQVDKSQNKVNILTEVSTRQDKVVSENMNKMKELEADLKLCIKKITQKEQQQAKLSEDLENMKNQLKQAKETIETNESLIHFLNKQIAAKDMTGKALPSNNTTNPKTIGSNGAMSTVKQTQLMQQQIRALKQSSAVDQKIQQLNMSGHLTNNQTGTGCQPLNGQGMNGLPSNPTPPEPTAVPRLVQFHGLPTVINTTDKNPVHPSNTEAIQSRIVSSGVNNRYQRNPLSGKTTSGNNNSSHASNNGFITSKGVK
jgi:hypothetical protein